MARDIQSEKCLFSLFLNSFDKFNDTRTQAFMLNPLFIRLSDAGNVCLHCSSVDNPVFCQTVEKCQDGEVSLSFSPIND